MWKIRTWILSRLHRLIKFAIEEMEKYRFNLLTCTDPCDNPRGTGRISFPKRSLPLAVISARDR